MNGQIAGRAGIITGGTSGFGLEIAKALIERGADVAAYSIDTLPQAQIDRMNDNSPGSVHFSEKDIMAPGASEAMVSEAMDRFGRLDFAIANAGFAIRFEQPLLEMPVDEITAALRTQFEVFAIPFASLALSAARVMAPQFENVERDADGHAAHTGAIIVNLSEAALIPLRDDLLAYSAAKHACRAIMRSLAGTLGPRNIRVNGIAPGFANTEGPKKFYSRFPQIEADIDARCHLKPSFMHPSAVTPAVLYLLSDNYVTGEVLALDGGYNINMCSYFQ